MFKDTVRQVVLGAVIALFAGGAAQAQLMKGFVIKVIGPDGKPVVGAQAKLQDLSNERIHFQGTTDELGEYTQTGTTPNVKGFKFTVVYQGAEVVRLIQRGDKDLKHHDASGVPIYSTLEMNFITIDLRKAITFVGTVKEKDGGAAAGAKLTATDMDDETKTFQATANAKGEYKLADMPFSAKGYKLVVERAGKEPVTQMLSVSQVGELSLDIDLGNVQIQQESKPNPAEEAREMYGLGDFEGALPKAEEALKDDDPDTRKAALLIKGQCLDKLGRNAEALAAFEQYLPMDPQNKDVVGVLSRLAEAAGEKAKAEKYQKQFVALGGKIVGQNFNKGVEALNAGDVNGAAKFLEAAVADDASDAEAHKALAMAYARTGNYRGVVEHLKAYLKLKPDAPDRGQWEAAIPTFENMAKSQK